MDTVDNCAANAIGRYKTNQAICSFCLVFLLFPPLAAILGFCISGKPLVELASAAANYVPVVVLVTCTFLINRKVIKDLQECVDVIDGLQIENDKLQWKLDAYRSENNELRDRLLESERRRKEAERLAAQYRRLLSKEQRETEESLRIANLNRPQRTSDRSRNISGCPRQQEYPKDVRTV